MKGRWWAAIAGVAALALAAAARQNALKSGGGPRLVTLSGRIQPSRVVTIASPLAGVLRAVYVQKGDSVRSGQLVARVSGARLVSRQAEAQKREIDQSEIVRELESAVNDQRLEVSRAESEAARAASELARLERQFLQQKALYQAGAAPMSGFERSERDYEKARSDKDGLEALARQALHHYQALAQNLDEARAERERTAEEASAPTEAEIRAPIDGTVLTIGAVVGGSVSLESAPIMQIAGDLTSLEVAISSDEPALQWLRTGQAAAVQIPAAGKITAQGYVKTMEPGGQFLVAFRSPSPEVKPGLPATVTITEARQ